ncbi:MAG: peptide ABC transporter substrate-binding protein [Opitutales bacterium]
MLRRLSLPLLVSLVVLATACSRRETPVEAGNRTHTLLVGNGAEPGDLDPHLASILSDQIIVNTLFEGLTLLDEQTTQPLPAAAESWTSSPDGLVWTFHLRPGLKWSNGDALVAGDFVQSWRRALDPKFAADNAWYLFAIKHAEAVNAGKLADPARLGATAPDDRTIVITLEHPVPYLPALVSLPAWFPVNPRVLAKFGAMAQRGTAWTRPGNLVSNGAFRLAAWEPNARLVVDKNPYYRDAAANHLEHIVFFPIEKPEDEEHAFRAGQLHVTFSLPVTKIAPWRAEHPDQLRIDPVLQINFLRFNTTRPPFNDPRVRRALAMAINRDLFADTVLQGSRQPAHTMTPPGTGDYQPPPGVHSDFDAARQLLIDAGHAASAGLPAIDLMVRNDELMPRLAEAIQAIWQRELNLQVTLSQVEQKTWIQNQQTLNYSVAMSAWTADFPDPVTFLGLFTSDSSYNWTGWNNPDYNRWLGQAAATADPVARFALLQRAEALLLHDAPVTPLFFGAQTYLLNPAVKGWTPAPLVFRRFQLISLQP